MAPPQRASQGACSNGMASQERRELLLIQNEQIASRSPCLKTIIGFDDSDDISFLQQQQSQSFASLMPQHLGQTFAIA
jgi:hypothetical protein